MTIESEIPDNQKTEDNTGGEWLKHGKWIFHDERKVGKKKKKNMNGDMKLR